MLEALASLIAIQQGAEPQPSCATTVVDWQIAHCFSNELEAEEARLEQYYEAALGAARRRDAEAAEWVVEQGLAPQEAENLIATQEAWKSYVELLCQSGEYQRSSGGTLQPVMYLGCLLSMTRQRTQAIWRDYLEGFDEMVLPEPPERAPQIPEPRWPD